MDLVIEERIEQWAYYEINYSVYQSYMQQLHDLKILDYPSLGMEELQTRHVRVKSCKLCNLTQKEI